MSRLADVEEGDRERVPDRPPALLEREAELSRLHHEVDAAAWAGGRVVLVRGEAGIGKSLLVRHFLSERGGRATTYLGRCDDLTTPQPWAPLWDIARERPALAAALAVGDRRRVMGATLELLSPPGGPAVLVIEDTQWADQATLDAITYVGRRIDQTRGVVLLTFRDSLVDVDHPLRRVLGGLRAEDVARVQLGPLSLSAVRTMAGGSLLDARLLHDLAGGNPLFVTEMLATGADEVPASVHDAVLARLSSLPERARRLVELVSIVPGRTAWSTVEHVLGAEPLDTRQALRHGLLEVSDDGVSFRHELQRRAVESSMSPPARRRLHARVLTALEAQSAAVPSQLAHHASAAGDTEALLLHAPRAGRLALDARSHREATEHFRSVGDHLDALPTDEAAGIVDAWARALWHVDASETVDVLVRAVALRRASGDHTALARTLAFGAFVLLVNGRGEQGAAWAAEAVDLVDDGTPSTDLAYALTEQARLLMTAQRRQALPVAERALAIAESVGDGRAVASALSLVGFCTLRCNGRALIERARAIAERGGHHFEHADALLCLAFADMHDPGDLALAELERARDLASEHEFLDLLAFCGAVAGIIRLWSGDWQRAAEEAAHVLTSVAATDAEILAECVLALLSSRQGRPDADDLVRAVWQRAARMGRTYLRDAAGAVVAEHAWIAGHDDPTWATALDELLRNELIDGLDFDRQRARFWRALSDRRTEVPDDFDRGHPAILDGAVEEAVAIWTARGAPYEQAIALLHGSEEDAKRAVRLLEDLGADGSASRGRALLRERGVVVPRGRSQAARDHAAGLTARQAEVLALLATGATNPDIADELFISRRTVESHVAQVLRRLDAADRDEAVATARRRGLLDRV